MNTHRLPGAQPTEDGGSRKSLATASLAKAQNPSSCDPLMSLSWLEHFQVQVTETYLLRINNRENRSSPKIRSQEVGLTIEKFKRVTKNLGHFHFRLLHLASSWGWLFSCACKTAETVSSEMSRHNCVMGRRKGLSLPSVSGWEWRNLSCKPFTKLSFVSCWTNFYFMLMFKPITGKLHKVPMSGSDPSGPWWVMVPVFPKHMAAWERWAI